MLPKFYEWVCIYTKNHPLEDLAYVGSGSVIIIKKEKKALVAQWVPLLKVVIHSATNLKRLSFHGVLHAFENSCLVQKVIDAITFFYKIDRPSQV